MRILVVNCGSSSLKLRVLESDDASGQDPDRNAGGSSGNSARDSGPATLWRHDGPPPSELSDEALVGALAEAPAADAAGHRIVHGGADFTGPTLIDEPVLQQLEALAELAPLHQPPALRAARTLAKARPELPAAACFDTSFHRTLPVAARTYPLPESWREHHPIQRYGFHGLSHAWTARRVFALMGTPTRASSGDAPGRVKSDRPLRLVSCHLGAGASLAAVRGGRCVDTTMGFTPLEGLAMATRSGSVDPGLVLWLIRRAGLSPEEVEHGLNHESGLAGLTGHADMRTVLNLADAGDQGAILAIDIYLRRLRAGIAAMSAALGGLDTLVFTGAVGEHAWQIRSGVAEGLEFLGVRLDETANRAMAATGDSSAHPDAHPDVHPDAHPDAELTGDGAAVRCFVVNAREDAMIAQATHALLTGAPGVF